MTHRYGRHGQKAWLRRRKNRMQGSPKTLIPPIAVLHVPLEFLRKIRKVTILMDDGTEESVELTSSNPLPPPTVESTIERRFHMSEEIQGPHDKFYETAREIARNQATESFSKFSDPYITKPDLEKAGTFGELEYHRNNVLHLWRSGGREAFLREVRNEYPEWLQHLSRQKGASDEGTQKLLVFARKDKETIENVGDDWIQARAFVSLFSKKIPSQQDVDEDLLNELPKRISLYKTFYKDFEPAKEED